MKTFINILSVFFLTLFLCGCRERFVADFYTPETGYLVVNGYINNGPAPTEIRLSRTTTLSSSPREIMEQGATVFIQSDQDDQYPLTEIGEGIYRSASLALDNNKQYRMVIAAKGKQYQSEYTKVQQTPHIDSITWKRSTNGVGFFANAHDDNNQSKYYQWRYEETWEINSPFMSIIEYIYEGQLIVGVKFRYPDRSPLTGISQCWTTVTSSGLLIGSTEKLSKDVIEMPLLQISPGSEKLATMYSILVKQYKISERAYNYLALMKKNTEQLGTIFDAQPSLVKGNIICVSDTKEPVVGFIEVVQEKRLRSFLKSTDIPGGWSVPSDCQVTELLNDRDTLLQTRPATGMPTAPRIMDDAGNIITFNTAPARCIDCRSAGGINQKPEFWP